MSDRVLLLRAVTLLALLFCVGCIWWLPAAGHVDTTHQLVVSFLDVGQGDAIFIEGPTGSQVLIDGGRDTAVLRQLAAVMPYHDRSLDMVVATHPDADHIGGLVDVLERFDVAQVLMTENESDTATDNAFRERVLGEEAVVTLARRGQVWDLGGGVLMRVLYPESDQTGVESNESSVVVQVTYGTRSFMLTGDAPKRIEEYLVLTEGEYLKSDVLKAGHHGSRTSTSELWLETVAPQYAVLSYGAGNRYGHPHLEVTDALFNQHVETHSTAEEGTVTFVTDGDRLWIE